MKMSDVKEYWSVFQKLRKSEGTTKAVVLFALIPAFKKFGQWWGKDV